MFFNIILYDQARQPRQLAVVPIFLQFLNAWELAAL